jgi:N-acetylneuraminate synthase
LSLEDHRELQEHCKSIGLEYSCSVWDVTAAKEIVSLNPVLIKVGSPSNQHWEMQRVLRDEYTGDVHISTGMTTKDEIEKIVSFWEAGKEGDARNRVVLYNCTSGYPVPFEDVCLLDIRILQQKYAHRVKAIGFSGHHLGIAIDIAAFALGAEWNERHFTKDRTWKGTDHAASLEPEGLSKLVRDLQNTFTALTYKQMDILDLEREQRAKLKWGQYNKAILEKSSPRNATTVVPHSAIGGQ